MKKQTIKGPSEASASEEKTNLREWSFSVGEELIKVFEKQQKQDGSFKRSWLRIVEFNLIQKQRMRKTPPPLWR